MTLPAIVTSVIAAVAFVAACGYAGSQSKPTTAAAASAAVSAPAATAPATTAPAPAATPTPPSRPAFLSVEPWPNNKEFGPETSEAVLAMINRTSYYCQGMFAPPAAKGIGFHGNILMAYCHNGIFEITFKPGSDTYSVSRAVWPYRE